MVSDYKSDLQTLTLFDFIQWLACWTYGISLTSLPFASTQMISRMPLNMAPRQSRQAIAFFRIFKC